MPRVRIEKGHLAFESRESFDRLFELPGTTRTTFIKGFESSAEFTSLREFKFSDVSTNQRIINGCNVPDSLIEDNEDFFSTLDSDGVIQIGSDLLRLDYCNSKVFVIRESISHEGNNYNDFLSGNSSNSNVGWFYTHVDILDALALNYRTMPDTTMINDPDGIFSQAKTGLLGITNKESKSFNDHDLEVTPINRLMDGKLSYDKFGFYFHFYGKEKYQYHSILGLWLTASTSSQGTDEWRVDYKYEYLRKGSGQIWQDGQGTLNAPHIGSENKVEKTFYSGSRGLVDGGAVWTVWNNNTDFVKVSRLLGTVFINYRTPSQPMPNYDLDDLLNPKEFTLGW